jgi:hypothetical protein
VKERGGGETVLSPTASIPTPISSPTSPFVSICHLVSNTGARGSKRGVRRVSGLQSMFGIIMVLMMDVWHPRINYPAAPDTTSMPCPLPAATSSARLDPAVNTAAVPPTTTDAKGCPAGMAASAVTGTNDEEVSDVPMAPAAKGSRGDPDPVRQDGKTDPESRPEPPRPLTGCTHNASGSLSRDHLEYARYMDDNSLLVMLISDSGHLDVGSQQLFAPRQLLFTPRGPNGRTCAIILDESLRLCGSPLVDPSGGVLAVDIHVARPGRQSAKLRLIAVYQPTGLDKVAKASWDPSPSVGKFDPYSSGSRREGSAGRGASGQAGCPPLVQGQVCAPGTLRR